MFAYTSARVPNGLDDKRAFDQPEVIGRYVGPNINAEFGIVRISSAQTNLSAIFANFCDAVRLWVEAPPGVVTSFPIEADDNDACAGRRTDEAAVSLCSLKLNRGYQVVN